jgi:hypothetical protein
VGKGLTSLKETGLQILAVTAFLSLKLLLDYNMGGGGWNEIDVLPLAKHYADPTWIPGDWYLNQPPGYRLLFLALFGNIAAAWGFLATSIIGRLLCYALVASGLVLIGRKLSLSLPLLLLAVGLFLYVNPYQSVVAYEWLVGGLEPKSVAYGLLLLAIGLMLGGRYRWMALMLGLATSFHVLVGGWAFLAVLGWLTLRRRTDFGDIRYLGSVLLIYLAASALAVWPVLEQLFTPTPIVPVEPSYIYVFLRLPHHLNPLSWSPDWWIRPILSLLILALSLGMLRRKRQSEKLSGQYATCVELAEFTLITLVPFILGLAIAPFDSQGRLLQYYPFRLGSIILPLNTYLVFACALEQTFTGRTRRVFLLVCIVVLSWLCSLQALSLSEQLQDLRQFPSADQEVDPQWKDMCAWVRNHTPQNAVVVSPPVEFANFTWLAERPTIAKFKLLPQNKVRILAWYERLGHLSGNLSSWPIMHSKKASKNEIERALTKGYNNLTTAQAEALMVKYGADYLVTGIGHNLDLAIAYRNSLYILYGKTHPSLDQQRVISH